METSPAKRRKLGHDDGEAQKSSGATAFEAAASAAAGMYRPSTFILETEELLKEVRVNYTKTFAGADELLHAVKSAVEAIESHDAQPVSISTVVYGS